ncbi:MAG: 3-deoxy-D-manno-octulosonic acid transferase [Phycisphaerae bacterium]|nr:3-deoxy-D-manno-octulosonic acid transferase [Phycisphaerae bacterium]MDD5381821.1 3-deoxy-D-manno-octulosonic acid transferase [Phycisphaerae bacterium]
MKFIIDCVYLLIAFAITPFVLYRMVRYGRYRAGWANRFGRIARKDPALKKCIWLHAVSLGEVNAAKTLVEELKKRFTSFEIVISTTTDTGFARATTVFGASHKVFYFPFDFSCTMRRAFLGIQPVACILMELEVWPNFVLIANQLHTPVIVVNGRLTNRSFSKYKKIKPLAKEMFRRLSLVLAQTDEYAQRFIEIGCQRAKVFVTGSLKYDTAQITDKVDGTDTLAEQLNLRTQNSELKTQLWVAGATGPGEEQIILEVYKNLKEQFKDLRLAIVPRKPERFDEVAQLIEQSGFNLIRYSQIKNNERQVTGNESRVILGDTMGDLRKFYSLATIIFAGRSLAPMGGSDMIEAAALGKCTIFGPWIHNFQQTADDLLAAQGGIMVKDKQDLLETMQKCLSDPDFTEKIARNGQNVIRNNQGATQKTIDHIAKFLDNA